MQLTALLSSVAALTFSIFFTYSLPLPHVILFFFFNDTATTEIYTLSLHDALPISFRIHRLDQRTQSRVNQVIHSAQLDRSEEHTSELQSHSDLVCRLLLEKKNTKNEHYNNTRS